MIKLIYHDMRYHDNYRLTLIPGVIPRLRELVRQYSLDIALKLDNWENTCCLYHYKFYKLAGSFHRANIDEAAETRIFTLSKSECNR